MNNDASLRDICKALPGERADFADTRPSMATPAQASAGSATPVDHRRRANPVVKLSRPTGRPEGVAIPAPSPASVSATWPMALAIRPPGTSSGWSGSRRVVIAAAGPIQGVRMGDPLPSNVGGSARVIELNDDAGHHGQLLVWERAARNAPGFDGNWMSTTAMLIALGAATAATVLLLQQRRRRLQRRGAAHR